MAETKKVAAVKPAAKAEVVARPVATVAVKTPEKAISTKEEVKVEVKPETKTPEKAATTKAPAAKAPAVDKPAVKAPAAKAPVAKAPAAAKPAAKTVAKKAPVKKTVAKPAAKPAAKAPAKKAEGKQIINLQFAGKSYSVEDITKIAGDVWKFDLHKSDEAYESLELYVKPEESVAYYVFNGEITGSFFI